MPDRLMDLTLDGPDATARFAERIARSIRPGDTILLDGEIGAGKTHFARCLIQSIQEVPEDVPSPTYTLIQTYETRRGEVVHADLYRISGPLEVVELGLLDAFGSQICLVEWPDRLGADVPGSALTLLFEAGAGPEDRRVTASGRQEVWAARLAGLEHV